jgi:hypothetical protein
VSAIRLAELALLAAPGPWAAVGLNEADDTVTTADDDPVCHAHPDDTRFIAAANPVAVRSLVERALAAEARVRNLEETVGELVSLVDGAWPRARR